MLKNGFFYLGLTFVFLAVFVCGILSQQGRPPEGQMPPMPLMKTLDLDGDNVLSSAEISQASQSLKKLDKNKDGIISREELFSENGSQTRKGPGGDDSRRGGDMGSSNPEGGGMNQGGSGQNRPEGMNDQKRPPAPPLIAALDKNNDGSLSANEILNASASLLSLDKDKNGQIDDYELRPDLGERSEGENGRDGDNQREER